MNYIEVESHKTVDQAGTDLEAAVQQQGFGVLHVHNLGDTLRKKGVHFDAECRVYEVCNPHQAAKVLATDLRLNNALPCRISVYSQNGVTKIGFIPPTDMLATLSNDTDLIEVAREVEGKLVQMINDAR